MGGGAGNRDPSPAIDGFGSGRDTTLSLIPGKTLGLALLLDFLLFEAFKRANFATGVVTGTAR